MGRETNCTEAADTLQRLREVPIEALVPVIDRSDPGRLGAWQPVIDGDFVREYGSLSVKNGDYPKLSLIIGTTSDEGASFSKLGLNTTEQIFDYPVKQILTAKIL
ncbi:hypothetical protein TWF481_003018 [Arthrobotrys musiformis]|uniref:Carboxylesterase type B domain-containing protein n=1 Tax=Arthrobotrys musiformis TaxID=47236 RepID=A0AAV9VT26_9PEZI